MQFLKDKNQTRFQEQNILNLAYAQYEGIGEYDMPVLKPCNVENLDTIPLQGFNFAMKDKNRSNKGVHFFLHDYQFERVWNYPDRYVEVLKQYRFVLSPDFSPYGDMPKALKIYNVYRNRWCARYWQDNGIDVIPTVTWGDEDALSYCLDGIPENSTIAISTMGEGRWGGYKLLLKCYDMIIDKLHPNVVLLYGKDLRSQLNGNIVYKPITNSTVEKICQRVEEAENIKRLITK